MSHIVRWDPFREIRQMMGTGLIPTDWDMDEEYSFGLAVDVSEDDDNVYIEADLPGFDPDNTDITVTADQATIKAERKEEVTEEDKKKNYLRRERRYGQVARTVALPCEVIGEDASAEFSDGKLTLTLPKAEEIRPKQVKVTAKKKDA